MLVEEVRDHIVSERADRVAPSLSHYLALILQTAHQNVRVEVDFLLDWVQKRVAITDIAKNLEASLALKRVVLALAQVRNRRFEQLVSNFIWKGRGVAVEHDNCQLMRVFFLIRVFTYIFAGYRTATFNNLLQLAGIFLYQMLSKRIT